MSQEQRRQRDGLQGLALPEPTTKEEAEQILAEMADALRAAQSTDDPAFVPTHDALLKRYNELRSKWGR